MWDIVIRYMEAPEGTVWEFMLNGTTYQICKLGDADFMASGGTLMVTGCVDDVAVISEIMRHANPGFIL